MVELKKLQQLKPCQCSKSGKIPPEVPAAKTEGFVGLEAPQELCGVMGTDDGQERGGWELEIREAKHDQHSEVKHAQVEAKAKMSRQLLLTEVMDYRHCS